MGRTLMPGQGGAAQADTLAVTRLSSDGASRRREDVGDPMQTGYIDSHAHLNTLTWTNLDEMSLAGIREIVSPIMLDAAKAVSTETIVELWDYLLEVQLRRAAEHFITGHGMVCVNMASSPREGPARLFALLPDYLRRSGVVAIGEVGFEPHSRTCPDLGMQEDWIRTQLQISRDTGMPIVIHTPNPPAEKRLYTEKILHLCASCGVPMAQVAIDHGSEVNIKLALDAGTYAAISVQPFRGMTPELACDLVTEHGFERIMLNSDCSPFHSDPLAVPKTALALRRRGVPEENIDQVCRRNSQVFYRI
jgi:uncharacterized protein